MLNKLWHNEKIVFKLLIWIHFLSRRGLLLFSWQQRMLIKIIDQHDRICEQEIYRKYQATIDKYANEKSAYEPSTDPEEIIWVLWWQGTDEMPWIIQKTTRSIHEHAGHRRVVLINQTNFQQYLDVPPEILTKVENGTIGLAAFSDYLRYALLEKHGGVWLDATMYLVKDIPAFDKTLDVVFPKHVHSYEIIKYSPIVQRYQHTFLMARKHTEFMQYMVDVLTTYLLTEPQVKRYPFAYDIALLGFEYVPRLATMVERIPEHVNYDMEAFDAIIAKQKVDINEYSETFAFKLTYKDQQIMSKVEEFDKVFGGSVK